MAKVIDCTTIAWVQEKADCVREIPTRNGSSKRKAYNDNINEIIAGMIGATFIVGLFFIGMIV